MLYKPEKCPHPMLAKREQKLLCGKLQAEMKKRDIGYLILRNPANVFYATGYAPLVGSGVAVVPVEGDPYLLISTLVSAEAYAATEDVDVREFMSWVFIDDGSEESRRDKGDVIDPQAAVHMAADIIQNHPMGGKIGLELGIISHTFYTALCAALPEGHIVDGTSTIKEARVIKTPWEVEMLRLAARQLDEIWQHMVIDIKPGMPAWKIDALYAYYAGLLNMEHGTMSRMNEFVYACGPYVGIGSMPKGYILKAGDIVKFDAGFKYLGYTSDIARTFAVGGVATDEAIEVYETLYRAKCVGDRMLKPGVSMSDIYHAVRAEVEKSRLIPKYPRGHVGHSIGCDEFVEEYPTLAPGTQYVLQPNMVISLELSYFATGMAPATGGFNLEDTHLITEDGRESFTTIPSGLFYR